MTSPITRPRRTLAVCLITVAAAAALTAAPDARAAISDKPCWSDRIVVKEELRTKSGKLLGKLYVFDEGKYLCAVTTSVGTRYWGIWKFMNVWLYQGSQNDGDSGTFSKYAGRVRLRDNGKCVTVAGEVELDSGEEAWLHLKCTTWRNKR